MSDKWDTGAADATADDDQEHVQTRFDELELALLDSKGLRNIPSPDPLIDGNLFRDSLAWIGGQPGSCKSFVAMEMAHSIGTGRPWFGHTTKQGKVLYIIAEGASGFSDRVETWEEYYGVDANNVTYLPMPIQFAQDIDVAAIGQFMVKHRYDLVIFDTQARCTVGLKENDSTDMGEFVEKLEQLRRLYGACLLLVHHTPRNGEHLRGSIAMDGAAASIWLIAKEKSQVTITTAKQKDIPEPEPFHTQLFPTHKSAVLVLLAEGEEALSKNEMHILATLQDIPAEWVSKTELKATCDLAETTFYANLNKLINKGYVDQTEGRSKMLRFVPEAER